jgi:hypothetical protein
MQTGRILLLDPGGKSFSGVKGILSLNFQRAHEVVKWQFPIKCLGFYLCLQILPTKCPVLFSIDGWEWFALNMALTAWHPMQPFSVGKCKSSKC